MKRYFNTLLFMFLCASATSFARDWNALKLKRLHKTYLSILLERAHKQRYENTIIQEKFSYNYLKYLKKLNNLLLQTAHSDDDQNYCNYGGWPTPKNSKGECYAPWDYQTRKDEFFKRFGHRYKSCGGRNKFRCHPLVFYVPGEEDGICVSGVNDKKPEDLMTACMKKHQDHQNDLIDHLLLDQKALAQYLVLAGESLRFCENEGRDYNSCREYSERLKDHAELTMICHNNRDLFVHLPGLINEGNRGDIDSLNGSGLATDFIEYMQKLDDEQNRVEDYNRNIIKRYIEQYSKDTKTKKMVKAIIDNSAKCLEGSCYYIDENGKRRYLRGVRWDKKAKTFKKYPKSSLEKCYRYVKYGLVDGGFHDNKWEIGGVSAVRAGRHLEKLGFKNIYNSNKSEDNNTSTSLENTYPELNAHNAPIGSILVYKSVYGSSSMHGHIEVKLANKGDYQYGSDYLTDVPISDKLSSRKLIGVYVNIPPVSEMEGIVKIPQVGDILDSATFKNDDNNIFDFNQSKKKKGSK